jgi:hypothetical protein
VRWQDYENVISIVTYWIPVAAENTRPSLVDAVRAELAVLATKRRQERAASEDKLGCVFGEDL